MPALFLLKNNMNNPNLHTEKSQLSVEEKEFENNIRPKHIVEFAGQQQLIDNLIIFIKAAKLAWRSIGSCFISWPAGFG